MKPNAISEFQRRIRIPLILSVQFHGLCSKLKTPRFQSPQMRYAFKSWCILRMLSWECQLCQILDTKETISWSSAARMHQGTGNCSPTLSTIKTSTNGSKTIWHCARLEYSRWKKMRRNAFTSNQKSFQKRKNRALKMEGRSIPWWPKRWRHLTSWKLNWHSKKCISRSSKWWALRHKETRISHLATKAVSRLLIPPNR